MTPPKTASLMVLFAALYFVQGIVEPAAGLPAQPLQAQLRGWRLSPAEVGYFFGFIGLGWSIKPLFGLVSDLFPLGGRRRRPYLLLATAATALCFLALALTAGGGGPASVAWLLLLAGLGIAMTDVVIDALAVERGQAGGITGEIQAVQWGALSVAGLIAGSLGGYIAEHGLLTIMLVACAALAAFSLAITFCFAREARKPPSSRPSLRFAWQQLQGSDRLKTLAAVAAFLFLWNFNPFSSNVLQEYATQHLRLSEQFFGHLVSLQNVGYILACVAYFTLCQRIPPRFLLHGCILAGILSTAAYWFFAGPRSAIAVSLLFGFAYQLGLLMQLDLAARLCPAQSAATTFALLMAIGNSGVTAATYLGGLWYDRLATSFDNQPAAYHTLVGIGAACTAAAWLVTPFLTAQEVVSKEP